SSTGDLVALTPWNLVHVSADVASNRYHVRVYAAATGAAVFDCPGRAFAFVTADVGVVASAQSLELVALGDGARIRTLAEVPGPVSDVAASPDGRLVACATEADLPTPVLLIDAASGSIVRRLPAPAGCAWRLAWDAQDR